MRPTSLLFICTIFGLSACDTDPIDQDPGPQDYRDAFVGTYNGWRVSTFWTINEPMQTTYEGSDNYTVEAVDDSSLTVNGSAPFKIGTDGQYTVYSGGSGFYSVRFVQPDSLLVSSQSGGLGGSSNTQFRGRR
ncbi:MAG: hypothetical protein K9J06_06770 [Flavobacteriales bacterium]|nr:hypothetical protein [Flavobacteriales bacterium]